MRVLRLLGILLIAAGIGLGVGGFIWSHYTNLANASVQEELKERVTVTTLANEGSSTSVVVDEVVVDDPTFEIPTTDSKWKRNPWYTLPLGEPIGLLIFPSLETEWAAVEGVGTEELKLGPGHMPWTSLPGDEGNATFSGHRTTYGGPFHDLHLLEVGDSIIFSRGYSPLTEVEYVVTETLIVSPSDIWVTEDREGSTLTLTTCNPIGSARERLVIFADKVEGRVSTETP